MLTTTLKNIRMLIESKSLDDARAEFADRETIINLSGTVLKKITREPGNVRLYILADDQDAPQFEIFANFPAFTEQGKIEQLAIKKRSKVSVFGTLRSFGETAVVLSDCKLLSARPPVKKAVKKKPAAKPVKRRGKVEAGC